MKKSVNGVLVELTAEELTLKQANDSLELGNAIVNEAITLRQARYRAESDPMYLEAIYTGDPADLQAWRDKVSQIKLEIPLQGE